MKRTVLIPLFYDLSPHLDTDFEIAFDLLAKSDDLSVLFLRCHSSFSTCIQNKEHKLIRCAECFSNIDTYYIYAKKKFRRRVNQIFLPKFKLAKRQCYLFQSVDDLNKFSIKGFDDIGRTITTTLVNKYGNDHRLDVSRYRDEMNIEIFQALDLYEYVKKVIKNYNIDSIYFFNGRFAQFRPLIAAAQTCNIEYYSHERGGEKYRYLLRRGYLPHSIEFAKIEQEQIKKKYVSDDFIPRMGNKFFTDREKNIDQGWISFTKNQKTGSLPIGFDIQKRNFVIYNSTIEEYISFPEWDNPLFESEIEALEYILTEFENEYTVHFYLRAHPNMRGLDTSQTRHLSYIKNRYKNVTVIMPDDRIHTYALLKACEKTITFGSTIGVEATYFRKPSILVGRSLYESLDVCYIPRFKDDIKALLLSKLDAKPLFGALLYGCWELIRGEKYKYYLPKTLFEGKFNGVSNCRTLLGHADASLVLLNKMEKKCKNKIEQVICKLVQPG